MPNGHGQREEDEKKLIESIEDDGWDYFPNPSDWIVEAAYEDGVDKGAGFNARYEIYYGDNYVYKVVSSVHGSNVHVFSRKRD